MPTTRVLVLRPADLHRGAARGALRRGAALPALRGQSPRRAARQRAAEDDPPPEPAGRSRPALEGEPVSGATADRRTRRRRGGPPTTPPAAGDDRLERLTGRARPVGAPVRIAFLGLRADRGVGRPRPARLDPRPAGGTLAAWSPVGIAVPAGAVADGVIDRRRRRPCRPRSTAPTSWSSPAPPRPASTSSTAWPGRGGRDGTGRRRSPTWPAPRPPSSRAPTPLGLRFVGGHPMAGLRGRRL